MAMRTLVGIGCLALLMMLVVPPRAAGNSSGALRIARDSQARWRIGAARLREKHGRVRVQADLVADGAVIAHLRLDPKTGEFVAEKAYADRLAAEDLARLKAAAARALSQVEVAGRGSVNTAEDPWSVAAPRDSGHRSISPRSIV